MAKKPLWISLSGNTRGYVAFPSHCHLPKHPLRGLCWQRSILFSWLHEFIEIVIRDDCIVYDKLLAYRVPSCVIEVFAGKSGSVNLREAEIMAINTMTLN
jgi:hypothetical protein